ncbi:MAG TPA: protein kinase [Acidimicrobiia bacterium]|nr:protein kinase [Acidimicrobiia bacterium]
MDLRTIQLRERIGEGGFGVVYRAYQPALDREVAVKVVHPGISGMAGFEERFATEARMIARIEHPHVVPLYDFWVDADEGGAVLVMRLVPGGSLADSLARGPWHPDQVARMVREIGPALDDAHRHGVVHGDVKPANLLIDRHGSTFVADFGIAVDLYRPGEHTARAGSPAYLAPEQLRGEAVTAAVDMYALGIVVWEALVGRHPFGDRDVEGMLRAHLGEAVPAVTVPRPDLSVRWNDVIGTATARDPSARFGSMADLIAAIGQASSGPAPGPARNAMRSRGNRVGNLPVRVSSFIGRDDETRLLSRTLDASRLVTLLGPGGIGKSSIAVEFARHLDDPPAGGTWIVDTTDLSDGSGLADRVADTMGVEIDRSADLTRGLVTALGDRDVLLILDSAEAHLDDVADFTEILLTSSPGVRIVVTSREPLQIPGEARLVVPPLGTADGGSDAVALFVDRTALVNPTADLPEDVVIEIVEKLDGLPLAIELAAARLGSLSVEQIREHLDHQLDLLTTTRRRGERLHDSLRATLAVSCDLLDDEELSYYRRLAVFRGGFTADAAAAVTGIRDPDLFSRLVDVSLITRVMGSDRRYRLLEPVRQYAQELLEASGGESEVVEAHLGYFIELTARGAERLTQADAAEWLERFDAEEPNTTAAATRALDAGDTDGALRLVANLTKAWTWARRSGTYDLLVPQLLEVEGLQDTEDLVTLLCFHVLALERGGDVATAIETGRRAVDVAERLGDPASIAAARRRLGFAFTSVDVAEAVLHLRHAIDSYRQLGSVPYETPLFSLFTALVLSGDLAGARVIVQESHELARRSGSPTSLGVALAEEGRMRELDGDLEGAVDVFRRGLDIWKADEKSVWRRHALRSLALISMARGDLEGAEEYLGEVEEIDRSVGDVSAGDRDRARLARLGGDLVEAGRRLQMAVDRAEVGPSTILEAALLHAAAGSDAVAARLFGAFHRRVDDMNAHRVSYWRTEVEETWGRLRTVLGQASFDAECEAGYDMDDEQVSVAIAGG